MFVLKQYFCTAPLSTCWNTAFSAVCFSNPKSCSACGHLFRPFFKPCLTCIFWVQLSLSVPRQITEVRRQPAAATGRCEGGSGHCGKEESAESPLSPAHCCNDRQALAASLSTSPTGCRRSWLWLEGTPTAPSRWTASMCGTPSGELGERPDFFSRHCLSVIQAPLPQTLPKRLFLHWASASSISPLLPWQWEVKEKEIPSVILTQISASSFLYLASPLTFCSSAPKHLKVQRKLVCECVLYWGQCQVPLLNKCALPAKTKIKK